MSLSEDGSTALFGLHVKDEDTRCLVLGGTNPHLHERTGLGRGLTPYRVGSRTYSVQGWVADLLRTGLGRGLNPYRVGSRTYSRELEH